MWIYLKDGTTRKTSFWSSSLLPKCLQYPELDQAYLRNQEFHPGLPLTWPPGMHINKKLDWKWNQDLISGTLTWDAGIPGDGLLHCATMLSPELYNLHG